MNKSIVAITLCLLTACTTTQFLNTTSNRSIQSISQQVKAKTQSISWMNTQIKGSVVMDSLTLPVTAQVRMKTDSLIWVSVSMLMGLEAIRLQITPDSLKVLNRLSSTYFLGNIQSLSEQYNFPLTFSQIQQLLLAQTSIFEKANLKLEVTDQQYMLNAITDEHIQSVDIQSNYLLQNVFYSRTDSQFVRIHYSQYQHIDSLSLPKVFQLQAASKSKSISADLTYYKTKINQPKKVKFSIPSSYVPM
ncbi:MAG: DUF4292 domain-containing protein [Flavobacteriales bacterium]